MIRKESADKDYQQVLSKVRRKRNLQKVQIASLASLCIGYSILIIKPHINLFIPASGKTVDVQVPVDTKIAHTETLPNKSAEFRQWKNKQYAKTVTSDLKAQDYTSSSDGPYLPVI